LRDAASLSFVRIIGNPVFDGSSGGANLIAAKKVRESYPELETSVTLFCDEEEKYISEHFAARDTVRVSAGTFS
jgi:cysteine synthase A